PACGGQLMRRESGAVVNFACKVGHRFSPQSLAAGQSAALENALWTALRVIEDSTSLARRLAARAKTQNHGHAAAYYMERVRHGEVQANLVRQALGISQETLQESDQSGQRVPASSRSRKR